MKRIKKLLGSLGPGMITGAADDDPSGIATYSQSGAQFGYSQLWAAVFTYPFMVTVQEMCGRIGLVTGRGLSSVIKKNYPKWILYVSVFFLVIANTVNIGADLGAMAASAQLLLNIPFIFWLVAITVFILVIEVIVPYPTYAKFLKYLTFSLFAYIITAFVVHQDWKRILISALVPTIAFSKDYLLNITAFLGTTISPYLFFWQADEEVEEEVEHGKLRTMGKGIPKIGMKEIKHMRFDTFVGMFFSNMVTFFIIITAASTLGAKGIVNIDTADQAAVALKPIAGNFAFLLFAAGIIGTGLLAVPVLAGSASYAISEIFNWSEGLSKKFKEAHGFYGVITFATIIGLVVNFIGIPPFKLLYYSAAANAVCAPPLLVIIMLISNNKKIMGQRINSRWSNILGWTITALMTGIAGVLIFTLIKG